MKQPQTLGIEYEITDLHDDPSSAPHGPARPERLIDPEVAHLSGGLFDSLPRVELPLDALLPLPNAHLRPSRAPTFDLPPPGSPLPPPVAPRGDSLYPMAADLPPPPPVLARAPAFPWGQTAIASAAGVLLAMVLMRPSPSAPAAAAPLVSAPLAAASPETATAKPLTGTPPATAASTRALPAAPGKPAPRVAAAASPSPAAREAAPAATPASAASPAPAAPPETAPVMDLAPSPTTTLDPLHRPSIDPPSLPPQRAAVAIASAARGAASCLDADDLRRTMAVSVTFSPSGHATRATVDGGPHRGTAAGSCIAQRLRTAVVKPFEGTATTIRTSITAR